MYLISNISNTFRLPSRLRLVLDTLLLLLLYYMMMLRVMLDAQMLLLIPDIVHLLLVVIWGCRVVLVKRILIMRLLPMDR